MTGPLATLSPEQQDVAQQVIDASPLTLSQLWILLLAAALSWGWIERRKRGKHAGIRARRKRLIAEYEEREGELDAARMYAIDQGELADGQRQVIEHLERQVAGLAEQTEDAITVYGAAMDRDLWISASAAFALGVVFGWSDANWQATAIAGIAGAGGSICSKVLHAIGVDEIWPWLKSKIPGYKPPPDDPPPDGPKDRTGTRGVYRTGTMAGK